MGFWDTALNVLAPATMFLPDDMQHSIAETVADVGAVTSAPIAYARGEASHGAFEAVDSVLENKAVDFGLDALSFIPGFGMAVDAGKAGYGFCHAMNDYSRGDDKSGDKYLGQAAWDTGNTILGAAGVHTSVGKGGQLSKAGKVIEGLDVVSKIPTALKWVGNLFGGGDEGTRDVSPAADVAAEHPAQMYCD